MRGRQIAPRLWTPRASRRWAQRSQAAALIAPSARIEDFATPSRLPMFWTFSRTSKGWEVGRDGILAERAVDASRLEHDAAAPYVPRGLFVEAGVVNGVRNNTMAGAVVGVIGSGGALPTNWSLAGLGNFIVEVLAVGTRLGRRYIRLNFKTPPATNSTTTLITLVTETTTGGPAASSGQLWTASAWMSLVASPGAAMSPRLTVQEMSGAGAGLLTNQSSILALTAASLRYEYPVTLSNASTATARLGWRFGVTNSAQYDFTVDLELPQLELGAYATSPIETTSAAVTRDTDKATRAVTFDPAVGYTVLVEWKLFGEAQSASDRHALSWDAGTVDNLYELTARLNATKNIKFRAVLATVTVVDLNLGASAVAGTLERVAFAAKDGSVQVSYNGGAIASATPATVPTPTTMRVGHRVGGEGGLNGAVARIVRIPAFIGGDPLRALAAGGSL